jgi:hypothetical protein
MNPVRPFLRKLTLLAHVTTSVGWLGAVVAFLALAVTGWTSADGERVRGAYLAMELIAWFVIVPLSLASPLTGIIQSLGTTWGLFRHYWVVVKLIITVPATVVLLLHMQPISHVASAAAVTALAGGDLHGIRIQLVASAGAAIFVLLVATGLSVFKPAGLTRYGRRMQAAESGASGYTGNPAGTPYWIHVFWIIVVVLLLHFIILHLAGGGLGHHAR